MKHNRAFLFLTVCFLALSMAAQTSGSSSTSAQVPPVIQFSNIATNEAGNPHTGTVEITFSLYNNAHGGAALWAETQNVTPDSTGHYSVYVGITKPNGVPMSLFTSGQAHWLGVQIAGQAEEPRVFLVSVPYAMKAGDATTVGGLPPSAFVLTAPSSHTSAQSTSAISLAVSGAGTKSFIPLWTTATKLGNSALFQSASGNIGIGTKTPDASLTAVSAADEATAVYGSVTSTSGTTIGVAGATTSSAGVGVFGNSFSTSGSTVGVEGKSASSAGIGVYGDAVSKSGSTVGVAAESASSKGVGLDGVGVAMSEEGAVVTNRPIGAWGDTNAVPSGAVGVLGTADDGIGVVALNNSSSGYVTLGAQSNESTDGTYLVFHVASPVFKGACGIDVSGNLTCTGSKSAAVPLADGRRVALYAVEAPENWFEDAGSGKLVNGMETVTLDPTFAETVNAAMEYHVFLTPQGECEGLYVGKKTPGGFEVRELHGGHSDVSFDYRILARRKGYEKIRLADVTEQMRQPILGSARPTPMAESYGAKHVKF